MINRDLPWLKPAASVDAETHLLLDQLWAKLTPEQATIAMYYFVDGLTHAEISRITDVSRRTVGNRIEEITVHLRALAGDRE